MSKFYKKNHSKSEEREYIMCFVRILPPIVKSWPSFIKYVGINVFPEEILPIMKNKYNKIVLDEDNEFVIKETPHTLQLIEFKSFSFIDRRTEQSATKFNVSFKVPIPRKSDQFYDYIMDELVTPLLHPTPPDDDDEEADKAPLARLSWDFRDREYYVLVALHADDSMVDLPCQARFRRLALSD
jgi:hypothetical protein